MDKNKLFKLGSFLSIAAIAGYILKDRLKKEDEQEVIDITPENSDEEKLQ